ncbi:DNA-binding transcriptional LysR family regulator [Lipingzhangella halophila]|uniref:DNA-binding transcriptional LysR family regulator n=1 Tax=Lipingzhangella halophila TaxID=1783352 RepID=A0A7W7W2R2_9ACTN|nr:LysR family transcriptional regulator [Lipingzhangella halophila]MBB4930960.1 DNA-binding transcriptional LysR family regulator [Lipingzhangella halophila]
MELRHLTTFLAVAHHLSFTRAAQELGYVQSSVTVQVKSLENDLDVALFERLGRRVTLTPAGEELRTHARELLERAEQAREAVQLAHGQPHQVNGTLRVAAPGSLCAYRLPGVLRRLKERFPRLSLVFGPAERATVLDTLTDGSLDVGFLLEEDIVAPRLAVERLADEPLRLVAHPSHPLAAAEAVTTADLGDQTMLVSEPDCAQREVIEREFQRAGIRPVLMEFLSIEAQKRCAAEGLGVAMVPIRSAADELHRGELVTLSWEVTPTLGVYIAHHRDRRIPALDALAPITRDLWRETPMASPG